MSDLISKAALFNSLANCHDKAEIFAMIQSAPTVDAVPVVRCKNCVHWQKPYIELNGGGRRDYADGEGFVGISVGVNVGSYCTLVDDVTVHGFRDGMPSVDKTMLWRSETDFCSRGERSRE